MKSLIKKWFSISCVIVFGYSNSRGMETSFDPRVMEKPFFVKGEFAVEGPVNETLKNKLGFYRYSEKFKNSKSFVARVYGKRLQLLASALYEQDLFFATLANYHASLILVAEYRAEKEAQASNKKVIYTKEKDGSCCLIGFFPMSQEAFIATLVYRDLMLCSTEERFLPELKKAVAALSEKTDEEVVLLRQMLQLKVKLFEAQFAYDLAKLRIDDRAKHVIHLKYLLEKTWESERFLDSDYFSQAIKQLQDIFATSCDFKNDEIRIKRLIEYNNLRVEYKNMYAAAITELNMLLSNKSIDRPLGLQLEGSALLPGIDVALESQKAGPSTEAVVFLEDPFEQVWVKETSSAPKKEKEKVKKTKKKKARSTPEEKKKEDLSSSEPEKIALSDQDSLLTDGRDASLSSEDDVESVKVYSIEKNDFVRAWSLYKISHQNTVRIPKFPLTYSKNIINWNERPEEALRDQGYYDESSHKFKRALAFASYKDAHEMRTYMKIYHDFPREIDEHIKRYGRVEIKLVKGRKRVDENRIVITMAGELELKDRIKRGLFSYIIDLATGTCYHRMFEPVEKNPLDPSFYDIYFMSAE